jgi:signal transduction histidine kinase
MKHRSTKTRTGHETPLWPVLLLLVAVLAPTGCLLWFMNLAIRNERLAVRQQLEDVYRGHLESVRDDLNRFWKETLGEVASIGRDLPGSAVFARCVRSGLADSAVCYDLQKQPAYPPPPPTPLGEPSQSDAAWMEASQLEQERADLQAAAEAYARIAETSGDVDRAARALQAQARCLVQAGQREQAVRLITDTLGDDKYRHAVDWHGRPIVASAELMALHLIKQPGDARFRAVAQRLKGRLADYDDTTLGAAQRRFLMKELGRLLGDEADFPTLPAEDLAARFAEAHPSPRNDSAVHPSQLQDLWQLASPDGRVVLLFTTDGLLSRANEVILGRRLPKGATARLLAPEAKSPEEAFFDSLQAGPFLPGWQLAMTVDDQDLFRTAADRQIALYLWTGVVVIAVMAVIAFVIARTFQRQMRLARLKNDLVATVSHELKTPLASIRLLVDTLLDQQRFDPRTVREYLDLVAKENARLSRLIDNFLAFSRMERNKQAFEFKVIAAADVVDGAADSVRERFTTAGCRFEVQAAPNLPAIVADEDAMVTAVLNLLDNAFKHTEDQKHIVLRAYPDNGKICFEVEDNGIGLTRRAARKVFERFYQVDRRLSRSTGGCGLGLSIVQFIVTAHGGAVKVDSQPGRGSRFTISIPAACGRADVPSKASG